MPEKLAESVFISHSSEDDGLVKELAQILNGLGVRAWIDSEQLFGGDILSAEICKAIEGADVFIVVASRHAIESDWVEREVEHAKSLDKRIVPLILPGVGLRSARRLCGEERVAIQIGSGASAIPDALPQILKAVGIQRPAAAIQHAQALASPVADLVLELTDPAVEEFDSKRRASAVARLIFISPDKSTRIESQRYRFTSPLGPIEAGEIEWYLERFVNWPAEPFLSRARTVEKNLPEWGRQLYQAVNVDQASAVLNAWRSADAAEGRFTIKIDRNLVAGSADDKQKQANEAASMLLGLPWELVHDEAGYLFQPERPVRVRRSLPASAWRRAVATDPPIRVLLVSPRPEDESAAYIDHRVCARPLVEALSRLGDLARLKILETPTFPELKNELTLANDRGEPYHVVHFDGHGVYDRTHNLGKLCFEDPADMDKLEARHSQLIEAGEIAEIVRDHRIPLFFLEACQSAQADRDPSASVAVGLLESGVASVAAMSHSVLVETASRFITRFYDDLLQGKRISQAMLSGQRALESDSFRGNTFTGALQLQDWFVPVLFQEEQDPQLVFEVPDEKMAANITMSRKLALGDTPPEPPHQFLGRSRDLLKAERLLSRERYLVVLGSGGEGKTTFAAELARWLVATHRFRHAAFTSVEQLTEARQILFSLGNQLVPNFGPRAATDDEHGAQLLEQALADQKTVLVIDNVESILESAGAADKGGILKLCERLGKVAETRLIFTSREALPAPFDGNVVRIGRLDPNTAIRVLSNLLPRAPQAGATEDDLKSLVDAVGGHARSLVLIAREVGAAGVRRATENLREVMHAIEAKHPGERENSLLASAELSLRRLPPDIRQLVRPLSVFHGGGGAGAIALALRLDGNRLQELAQALIGVGLAEYVEPQYLRFDPAIFGVDLSADEREQAASAWAQAMEQEIQFLYQQQFQDAAFAHNLTLLELPNLLLALNQLANAESVDNAVNLAISLESLVSKLDRPKVLARVVEIRESLTQKLSEWSHARFMSADVSIGRLLDQGRYTEAIRAARLSRSKFDGPGESAYEGAVYDAAMAEFTLGRALKMSGQAQAALSHLESANRRFVSLNEARMAGVGLTDIADCLRDLGRYEEAVDAYQQSIAMGERRNDARVVAVGKFQLANLRYLQKSYADALHLYTEARDVFGRMNEMSMVARSWHQIAMTYARASQYEAAEQAYQKSLAIKVATGDRSDQASTLSQLGNLYFQMGRPEDAINLYRQAAETYVQLDDLRSEGVVRHNAAAGLIELRRYDEARQELDRAIACKQPFGHVAATWQTFSLLCDLERAVGNETAALAARRQAMEAYLAYRRDGGASEIDPAELLPVVKQDPAAARTAVDDPEVLYRVAAEILLALESLS